MIRPFKRKRDLHHHMLFHLHPKTKVSISARICIASKQGQHNLKVVLHKKVVVFLYVLDVVDTTKVSIVMD